MNEYITLGELRRALSAGSSDTEKDELLASFATTASRIIDRETVRSFYPRIETRKYDIPKGRKLSFGDDLLTLSTLTNGDDTEIASTDYLLYPANEDVKYAVELELGYGSYWTYDSAHQITRQVIDVAGIWGWHDEWSLAWDAVDVVVVDTAGLSASATSVVIADYNGPDSYGFPMAIDRQKLIKVEDEYMYVIASTENTGGGGTLTVIRGVNGSTAATHSNNDVISVYRPPETAKQIALRLALWLYKQRLAKADIDRPAVTADGVTVLPMQLPTDVIYMLSLIKRVDA